MNINKHDAGTDMEMDMTPMIDVVFLLIIFFMIITDLSQKELEDLKLPIAVMATEDKPNPDDRRPILNIRQDGTVIVQREVKYDPELNDYSALEIYLSQKAGFMEKVFDEKLKINLPDDPILIRADENTPFKMIQKIMLLCGQQGIQIWKVQLAAAQPEEA